MKEWIYLGFDENEYHSLPPEIVSNSYLSRLDKCPANARVPQDTTPTLEFGQAVHSFVLEGKAVFDQRFAVAPAVDRRTVDGKAAWAEFVKNSEGKIVVKAEDFIKIYGISEAVRAHPFAAELLADGIPEVTSIWKDKATEITCKCRPDWVTGQGNFLVDLKTTKDAGEYGFARSVSTYKYMNQAAFYSKGYSIASGTEVEAFIFIAVEKEFPFRTEVYEIEADFLEWGSAEIARLLKIEVECRRKGHYPHFVNAGCGSIAMPGYINR